MVDFDELLHQILALAKERDVVLKKYCDELCSHCKNKVECNSKECKEYISGTQGYINDKPVEFNWSCEDFDYGTCPMMEHTPCNGCFERDYDGFCYAGDTYDFQSVVDQIKAMCQNGQSAIDTNQRLSVELQAMRNAANGFKSELEQLRHEQGGL